MTWPTPPTHTQGRNGRSIGRHVRFLPTSGLTTLSPFHLMVVLPELALIRADVEPHHHLLQCLIHVLELQTRALRCLLSHTASVHPGNPVMQEIHVQVCHYLSPYTTSSSQTLRTYGTVASTLLNARLRNCLVFRGVMDNVILSWAWRQAFPVGQSAVLQRHLP